jgi:hypothetical protein
VNDPRELGGPLWVETKPHRWQNAHLGDVEAWTRDNWLHLIADFRHRAELRIFDPADTLEFVTAWARVEHRIELARVRGLQSPAASSPSVDLES